MHGCRFEVSDAYLDGEGQRLVTEVEQAAMFACPTQPNRTGNWGGCGGSK